MAPPLMALPPGLPPPQTRSGQAANGRLQPPPARRLSGGSGTPSGMAQHASPVVVRNQGQTNSAPRKPAPAPGSIEELQARNSLLRTKLEIAQLRAENAELKLDTLKRKYDALEKEVASMRNRNPALGGALSAHIAP